VTDETPNAYSRLVPNTWKASAWSGDGTLPAAAFSQFIAWLWPSARLTAFAITATLVVVSEISATIHEIYKGRCSTGFVIIDFMPLLLLGAGVSLVIGRLIGQWVGSDWGTFAAFFGIYYCILIVAGGVNYTVKDRKLKGGQGGKGAPKLFASRLAPLSKRKQREGI
jgi:hypothetical protein